MNNNCVPQLKTTRGGWKFRQPNQQTLALLINREIWFANPETLNDPFDATVDVKEIFSSVRDKMISGGRKVLSSVDSPGQYLFANNQNDRIPLIFSLCGTLDHQLMWAHYAFDHKGIALGFDFSGDTNAGLTDQVEVIYDKSLEEICEEAIVSHNEMKKSVGKPTSQALRKSYDLTKPMMQNLPFLVKNPDWSYEKEVRLFKKARDDTRGVTQSFDDSSLKYIVFGVRCEEYFKKTVINITRVLYPNTKILNAGVDLPSRAIRYF